MIFDCHTDILYDLVHHSTDNPFTRWKMFHLPRLRQGGFSGVVAAYYSTPKMNLFPYDAVKKLMIESQLESTMNPITQKENLINLDNKFEVLWALEGLFPFETSDQILDLVNHGIRMISFTWNESNRWANGVNGKPDQGLTKNGIELLTYLESYPVIIDVSHANLKTVQDILKYTKRPVIASHSNAQSVFYHNRNLNDEILISIAQKGGFIAVNAYPPFLGDKPTIDNLIDHITYLINMVGIDHVGLGFDFMDFLESSTIEPTLPGLESAIEGNHIIDALKKVHLTEEEIAKITRNNMRRILNQNFS